jgi:competence ComEA-like helix-hairpin-helix protein
MKRFRRIGFVTIAALSWWLSTASIVVAQTMRAHFIDVGQGAATLIEFPCAAVLIDTGGESNGEFDSTAALMDYLDSFFSRRPDLGNTFASIILTHPHVDHTRGVPTVIAKYKVQNAVTNGLETGSGKVGQIALHKKASDSEAEGSPERIGFVAVHRQDVPQGTGLTNAVIDPVSCPTVDPKITALWGSFAATPPGWTATDFGNLNNHSVAIRVDFGKASFLVTGDLEEVAIRDFIAAYQGTTLLDVDVYQVGHHGSANGTTEPLLRAITPAMAVIAMGPPSRQVPWTAWAYGHPRKVIVDLLQKYVSTTRPKATVQAATGVKAFTSVSLTRAIYGTGWDGTVVLEADVNGTWKVAGPPAPSALLNLNTASVDELSMLPRIGPVRANAIVRYRTENGPFSTVDDLGKVPGIGPSTLNAIRSLVRVGG